MLRLGGYDVRSISLFCMGDENIGLSKGFQVGSVALTVYKVDRRNGD